MAVARVGRLPAEWLEQVRLPDPMPRDAWESRVNHSAAKALLLLRRGQHAAAARVVNDLLVQSRNAIGSMARQQEELAEYLRCANYGLLAQAAGRHEEADQKEPVPTPVQVDWPFDTLPPTVDHPALDLELRRHIALTWRPGRKLPIRIGLTAHAFVPDPG